MMPAALVEGVPARMNRPEVGVKEDGVNDAADVTPETPERPVTPEIPDEDVDDPNMNGVAGSAV